ncbi:hypothetical protein [Antrihabitans sp. YC2-6]|uniref:hypothetical protein n=1 Tax=Antrihabitans sp. YC2-6 TaxID=2799498 RepID=UPI0018F75722|nr:hypothetical protein [Antrihabitans sp. YC2-6]MBJ8343913.1 hypothetical protein [Antrihabitans sp. YC2-6]
MTSIPFSFKTIAASVAVATAAGLSAVAFAAPASAATVTNHPIAVSNCNSTGQICAERPTVTVNTNSGLKVEFTASRAHCSDMIAHIYIDGAEWGSAKVGPGQRDGGYFIPVTPGTHDVSIVAEGVTGGCNTGKLASWAGNLRVETN